MGGTVTVEPESAWWLKLSVGVGAGEGWQREGAGGRCTVKEGHHGRFCIAGGQ